MKKDEKKPPNDMPVQMAIDPETGRDITGEVISRRLKELDIVGDEIIESAMSEYKKFPDKKMEIYEKAHWEIHEKIGTGSIGPATAAAGPLMYEKKAKLADMLNIEEKDRLM
jgi:hypothetical protein